MSDGLVTGSDYDTHVGCRPYPFPPCEHHNNHTYRPACKKELYPTPKCVRECESDYGDKSYAQDKFYGKSRKKGDEQTNKIIRSTFNVDNL